MPRRRPRGRPKRRRRARRRQKQMATERKEKRSQRCYSDVPNADSCPRDAAYAAIRASLVKGGIPDVPNADSCLRDAAHAAIRASLVKGGIQMPDNMRWKGNPLILHFAPRVRIAHATQPGRLATFTKPTRVIASAKKMQNT